MLVVEKNLQKPIKRGSWIQHFFTKIIIFTWLTYNFEINFCIVDVHLIKLIILFSPRFSLGGINLFSLKYW